MRDIYTRNHALLDASTLFDPEWYLLKNKDVALAGLNPVDHYLQFGADEGRNPGPFFHSAKYLRRRPDVRDAKLNPLVHFLRHGLAEITDDLDLHGVGPFGDTAGHVEAPSAGRRKLGRKAVFVTHDMNIGGAPRLLANIARWFQQATDYDVRIVSMGNGPLLDEMLEIAPVHIVGTLEVADGDVAALRDAVRAFVGEEPAFTFVNSAAAGHYCKIDPFVAPRFGFVHEMPKVLEIYRSQAETLFARTRHVFCGGDRVHAALIEHGYAPSELLSVRPSFVNDNHHDVLDMATKAERKKAFGWDPETKIVMACGVAHWRKQPEVFVRLAAHVAGELGRDARFVWVGDGEDVPAMEELARELEIEDRLELMGNRDDFPALVAAADVFALTSSEDPFPLVCVEAALASAPVVCFREATSFAGVIEADPDRPAGIAVPIADERAFYDAVDRLVCDDAARQAYGATARERALTDHTTGAAAAAMLREIRTMAGLRPRISAVVPSYNCGPYLQQRLASIADQSFKDMEILLCDDRSTDDSPEILAAFVARNPDATLILAEENSGSVFKAWSRAIGLATGDIVWICEADDWAEPDFVERALTGFEQSGTRLVHGRSIPVNSEGQIAGDWNTLYLDKIVDGRWHASYSSPAAKEVREALGFANTIPNGSAVLVLRSAAQRAAPIATGFKLAGDWAFYLAAIAGGRVAYVHEAVNYHRRHQKSVTAGIEGTDLYFQELADIGAIAARLYGPHEDRDARLLQRMRDEAARFAWDKSFPEGRLPASVAERPPGLIYGVGDLSGGGAQMYAVRFANGWSERGAASALFVTGHEADQAGLRRQVSPEVPVLGPDDVAAAGGIPGFLTDWGIDAIVSGHWWADVALGKLIDEGDADVPWTIVMHGCYESVIEGIEGFPNAHEHFARAQARCGHWIWIAEKNRQLFDQGFVTPRAESHVASGFRPVATTTTRTDLGLPEDAFIFTLVSRAIESKGWLAAVDAIGRVRARAPEGMDVRLLLIGDGPVAKGLEEGGLPDGVQLVAHTSRVMDFMASSDVGLLPSWFVGESLPLVVVEFLSQGKPVIVSDIGMSPWCITAEDGRPGGIVVPRDGDGGQVPPDALADAMLALVEDRARLADAGDAARAAFAKFDFDLMLDRIGTLATGGSLAA